MRPRGARPLVRDPGRGDRAGCRALTPLPTEPTALTAEPTTEPTVEPTSPPDPSLLVIESDDARVQQAGTWTAHDTALASGGRYLYSSGSAEDSLSLTFEGTRLDLVYVQHPSLAV